MTSYLEYTLLYVPEFRSTLMSMLRPMDFLRLVFASHIITTPAEEERYMAVWRQICFDMHWVSTLKERKCTVTVVGNDLRRLYLALRRRDHTLNIDMLRFVIVVGGTGEDQDWKHDPHITESFDTTVRWHDVKMHSSPVFNVAQKPTDVQTSIFCLTQQSWMSFDDSWAEVLYQRHKPIVAAFATPGALDTVEAEFHQLDSDPVPGSYNPVRMHYIVHPWKLDKYATRIFITPQRGCLALLMKRK